MTSFHIWISSRKYVHLCAQQPSSRPCLLRSSRYSIARNSCISSYSNCTTHSQDAASGVELASRGICRRPSSTITATLMIAVMTKKNCRLKGRFPLTSRLMSLLIHYLYQYFAMNALNEYMLHAGLDGQAQRMAMTNIDYQSIVRHCTCIS
jgi:hypothetical protein